MWTVPAGGRAERHPDGGADRPWNHGAAMHFRRDAYKIFKREVFLVWASGRVTELA